MSKLYELDMKGFMNVVSDLDLKTAKHIRKLSIPRHIIKLPIGAFSSCKELKKVYIENGSCLREIPEHAFSNCSSLSKINQLPDELVSINAYAFLNCINIDELIIPSSVIYIDENAFTGWTTNQIIYVNREYQFGVNCKANIININQSISTEVKEDEIYIEDGLKFYIVRAKCGHVGRPFYIPIDYPIRAKDAKEAAQITRKMGRVKHGHKDAILSVTKVSKNEYMTQRNININDPYLNVRSKHDQVKINHQLKERMVQDPHYVARRNKKYVISKKNDLSSGYKMQKAYKNVTDSHRSI